MTQFIKEVNAETGVEIEREMNAEELKQYKNDADEIANRMAKAETRATAKAALLEKLGITEDEAKLLLG